MEQIACRPVVTATVPSGRGLPSPSPGTAAASARTGQARPLYPSQRFRAARREVGGRSPGAISRPPCREHRRRTRALAVLPQWTPSEQFAPRAPVQGQAGIVACPGLCSNGQGGKRCLNWYVGVDWGAQGHKVCVLDGDGAVLGESVFAHSGPVVESLLADGLAVSFPLGRRPRTVVPARRPVRPARLCIFLIPALLKAILWGACQMRQHLRPREHFGWGNAHFSS